MRLHREQSFNFLEAICWISLWILSLNLIIKFIWKPFFAKKCNDLSWNLNDYEFVEKKEIFKKTARTIRIVKICYFIQTNEKLPKNIWFFVIHRFKSTFQLFSYNYLSIWTFRLSCIFIHFAIIQMLTNLCFRLNKHFRLILSVFRQAVYISYRK